MLTSTTFNVSDEDSPCEPNGDHLWLTIFSIIWYVVIFIVGVIGNTLVTVVIFGKKTQEPRRQVHEIFIGNLAIVDLLFTVMSIPIRLALYLLDNHWVFGSFLCMLAPSLIYITSFVSSGILTSVSIERHRCIVYPMKSRYSSRQAKLSIALIWAFSIILVAPFTYHLQIQQGDNANICSDVWTSNTAKGAFFGLVFVLQFVVPIIVMSFAYLQIARKLREDSFATNSQQVVAKARRNKLIVRLFLVVIASYLLCTLPIVTINLITIFREDRETTIKVLPLRLLQSVNGAINPIIYGALNKSYREAFIGLFKTCCKRPSAEVEAQCTGFVCELNNDRMK